jgi:hypothetical protein
MKLKHTILSQLLSKIQLILFYNIIKHFLIFASTYCAAAVGEERCSATSYPAPTYVQSGKPQMQKHWEWSDRHFRRTLDESC